MIYKNEKGIEKSLTIDSYHRNKIKNLFILIVN